MIRNLLVPRNVAAALSFLVVATTVEAAGVSGAIFTTTANGSAVNANQFSSKCAVYLDGGPGPNAPAKAAGLPNGDYYFQVTDPSGGTLLSTDIVSNRKFTVSGGVITASAGTHSTGTDLDHGAITIGLCEYANTPNTGNVYKVWATPVGDFVGNPSNVDNPNCGSGCFHGFKSSKSKTDNFKALSATPAAFCLTIQKQRLDPLTGVSTPVLGWHFQVTDPAGVTNQLTTDASGQISACQLVTGTYSVTEDLADPTQPVLFPGPYGAPPLYACPDTGADAYLNGTANPFIPVTFTWTTTQPVTVLFVNYNLCIG